MDEPHDAQPAAAAPKAGGSTNGARPDVAAVDESAEQLLGQWVNIEPGPMEKLIRYSTLWIWDILFRLRTYGSENIPAEGPFLFCPNHSSWFDPFLQVRGRRRVIRFMGKAQLFDIPVIRSLVRACGGFPVRRGQGDSFAMELASRILRSGQPLCMYPEGTRYRANDELGPARRGAARLALETGVPVIPVASHGTKPRAARGERGLPWKLPRITTIYGPMLRFDHLENTPENVELVRDEMWAEVQRLFELARELNGRRVRPRRFKVPSRPAGDTASAGSKAPGRR